MDNNTSVLPEHKELELALRRRDILPWWVKIFTWIFLIFGIAVPVGIVFGILGINFEMNLYGISSFHPFSVVGFSIITLFVLKAITAFGLWTEKDWAFKLGFIDAISGMLICLYGMVIAASGLRIEIAILIPYFIWLNKSKVRWETFNTGERS